jgi:hypothetical protein
VSISSVCSTPRNPYGIMMPMDDNSRMDNYSGPRVGSSMIASPSSNYGKNSIFQLKPAQLDDGGSTPR